jgi:hypothetical protein
MTETYSAHGVRFQYPDDWEVSEQQRGAELVITVTSPETSFFTLGLLFDRPSAEAVVETVIEALREEYEDLDDYEVVERVAGQATVARDVEFFCLELLNSAWVRAFALPRFTVLVFYQANDRDLEEVQPVFEQILDSLAWEEDDEDEPGFPWSEGAADVDGDDDEA